MTNLDKTHFDFDDIVVGSGLAGLMIAHQLRKAGRKVALFEQKESFGGQFRKIQTQAGDLPSSLCIFPRSENFEDWQSFLVQTLNSDVQFENLELQPKTYENAQFKNFVGFGDQNFKSIEYLSAFNRSEWMTSDLSAAEWIELLLTQEGFKAESLHEVTEIKKGESGFKVTVNGGKDYSSEKVYFTPAPSKLLTLIGQENLPGKISTRLAKAKAWTTASLHLAHTAADFEENSLYFILGSKNDFEPSLGRFFKGEEAGVYSYWFTLIAPEQAEDNEYLGNAIKNIKKGIKRLFPELSEAIRHEKITISPEAFGDIDLKLKTPFQIPEWEGLFLASHLMSSVHGPMGHVDVAQQILKEAGYLNSEVVSTREESSIPAPGPEASL